MTHVIKEKGKRKLPFDEPRLKRFVEEASIGLPIETDEYFHTLLRKIRSRDEISADEITNLLLLTATDLIGVEVGQKPEWTFFAGYVYLKTLYKKASVNRVYHARNKYGKLYPLLVKLTTEGIYDVSLLEKYSIEEIEEIEKMIEPERDRLFTYVGVRTLAERYLATDHEKNVYELPQERWAVIAMKLMINEPKDKRLNLVKEAYWALSNLYMTVATPTLANAGKSYGQLSSCFIDTVDDSLQGIYDSNTDVANLSKNSGGIGVYIGKVRSRGSSIKGFKNVSSGVVPWIRQLNNTAVSVDQLGQRNGSIAVYLDVWHRDIFPFLDLRLNNGDERQRATDIFLGVCLPDLFMEAVEKRSDWYLFDPHEVRTVMGYSLEDYFDEKRGKGSFREKYEECINHPNLSKERVKAIDIMKAVMKSQLETGTPYMFYRDEVNRMNVNKHTGMIYCSNLCSEITQNQSPTTVTTQYLENGEIVIRKSPGDFVVCNLSSINLARAVGKEDVLERLIPIQVRMLDNVIDLNTIPVLQAEVTNKKYRAVGLGQSGWHQLLALKKIRWESDAAVQYADELYERIAYLTIKASHKLALEKGAYPLFEGSEWESGEYFARRGYIDWEQEGIPKARNGCDWEELQMLVSEYGIRNSYLMATAPTGSTSLISGSTAGIDPIFKRVYAEEKKDYRIPVTAPDLSMETFWFYKNSTELDQHWSIKQNAARQKHVDQSQSFNLYVKNDIKASELLALHLDAWKSGLKTTYYVRSTSTDIADCEVCSS